MIDLLKNLTEVETIQKIFVVHKQCIPNHFSDTKKKILMMYLVLY